MTTYSVNLVFHEVLDDTTTDRLLSHEPSCRSIWRDVDASRTEVLVETDQDTVNEALATAIVIVSAATSAPVNSAEVLSAEERVHRVVRSQVAAPPVRQTTDHL